jgi:hypothetical protein
MNVAFGTSLPSIGSLLRSLSGYKRHGSAARIQSKVTPLQALPNGNPVT